VAFRPNLAWKIASKISWCNIIAFRLSSQIMEGNGLKEILKNHKLRVTDIRLEILDFFVNSKKTHSHKDLEEHFSDGDRVTLYRTLSSFTEQGLLHKIPDESGHVNYGLCPPACGPEEHHHDHIHFKCNQCGEIECVDTVLPKVELPGYQIDQTNLILSGTCESCLQA
jgi:Fur family ferric uptake transcriptional regulator